MVAGRALRWFDKALLSVAEEFATNDLLIVFIIHNAALAAMKSPFERTWK
jgi:hypothetical protein